MLPSGYRILNTAIRSVPVKESKIARVVPSKRLYVPEVGTEFFEDSERYVLSVSAMTYCRHFADKLLSMS